MTDIRTYEEKVSSKRTEALFVALAILFLFLLAWRATTTGLGALTIVFFCLFCLFSFYSLNYRTLIIRIAPESLKLSFGIFTWTVPLETIEACYLDDVSLWRLCGAGIHFTIIRRRYRAIFNFLEHPRVVLELRKKGLVRAIAFSTRRPDEVRQFICEIISKRGAA